MTAPVKIIGSYISPYVRKVLVCLDLKGIAYEIDPIIPFMGDDRLRSAAARRIRSSSTIGYARGSQSSASTGRPPPQPRSTRDTPSAPARAGSRSSRNPDGRRFNMRPL